MTIAKQLNAKEFPFKLFDENANLLYFESEYGYWAKYEYDANNNKIFFQNSADFWSKREYDANGNEIYYENSNGYIEDNRK